MGNCISSLRGNRESPESPLELELEGQPGNCPVLEAAEHHRTGCEEQPEHPVSDTAQPREVTVQILFHCVLDNTVKENRFTLKGYPESVLELKDSIQAEYGMPASCQRVYFESALIGDKEDLGSYRIRDGDTLHVHYNSEGDVKDVLEIISSMREMVPFLESIQPELSKGALTTKLDTRISRSVKAMKVESLVSKYFWPSSTERANANCLFFVSNNGLKLMLELQAILLQQPWEKNCLEMHELEYTVLSTLWNLTATSSIRTLALVLRRPMLDAITQSLLRQDKARGGDSMLLREVKLKAVETICNLAKIPEYRLQIASNMKLLEQFIAVLLSRAYKYGSSVTIASFLYLSYSPETHLYLTRPTIIEGVIQACEADFFWSMLPWNFTIMFFAQLATSSPHLLRPEQTTKLYNCMNKFLSEADYGELWEEEVENGYIWSTTAPFVKLAYFPYANPNHACSSATHVHTLTDRQSSDVETVRKLQELCVEAGIFNLQNILSGAPAREILVEEGLVEYVICLPWCTLPGSRAHERARVLVSALRHEMQLRPPRLGTLARAKLAAWHFGLEKMLQTTPKLLAEVYHR